jgi:DNA-binding transcriptional LysR family regulator
MLKKIDWESQIGRRLKLRDLHVFIAVVRHGSMAKAAQQLGVTQPSVSEVIADLEHVLGVRLLDRRPQGVEPTIYGGALVRRSVAVFDELKQTVRDIEFMSSRTSGDVRIGCQESIAAAILPSAIRQFSQTYPRVVLHVEQLGSLTLQTAALRERRLDVAIFRFVKPIADEYFAADLNVQILFHDQLIVATGTQNRWARRRKIDLAELVNEPWILPESDTWNYLRVAEAFQARGLDVPKSALITLSTHLRANLAATGPYITTFPKSTFDLYSDRFSLKALPIQLPSVPWPVVLVTLKNRTLSPVVERFIEHVCNFTRPAARQRAAAASNTASSSSSSLLPGSRKSGELSSAGGGKK